MKSLVNFSKRLTGVSLPQLAFVGLLTITTANAGLVIWDPPQTITDDLDISTDGTLVAAHNLGGSGITSATLNGVTFTPFPTTAAVNTVGNVTMSAATTVSGANTGFGEIIAPFATLSPDYQVLLESGSFTSGAVPATISLALNGLTPGAQYQFQWWANQSDPFSFDPNSPPPGVPTTTATAGNSVTLDRTGLTPGSVGQFALGVFTADATASQTITFDGAAPRNLLNAFQLRQIGAPVVPEPGSCLFGIAMTGVVLSSLSRRRTKIGGL